MNGELDAAALRTLMDGAAAPLLLHVLPEEHYAASHLPGAKNACIYETAFLDRVRGLVPDLNEKIVVYGEGDPFLDSREAAARLRSAGYRNVADLRGGLRAWRASGFPVEGSGVLPTAPALQGRYLADVTTSVVRWTGCNLTNHHSGDLPLAGGEFHAENGRLVRVELTGDLTRIRCEDLADAGWNAMLVAHLKTADFFDVDNHPHAHFISSRVEPIANAGIGRVNVRIAGSLRLRGVVEPVEFDATLASLDNDHLTLQAMVALDRTRWGSLYGSSRFFAFLGKHVVNDVFNLHLKVHAARSLE
ncbi:MAG TPA: YceI family protein [Kiritimatiellia bacterium]|nr:YceI family protein [Kiritimatiellia bacterium]